MKKKLVYPKLPNIEKPLPEVKTIDLLKGIKRKLEQGKDYDDFILDTNIQKKFSEVFKGTSFSIKQVIAIINIFQKEVKRLWRARKDLEKVSFSKRELSSMQVHLENFKKVITENRLARHEEGKYLDVFKSEKVLGNRSNDKWLDYVDEILEAISTENKSTYKTNKIKEIEYFACKVGVRLEKFDKRLKPSTYFNESTNKLGLGGEFIYIVANYYDKRITKRTLKEVFKNFNRIKKRIRRIDDIPGR